jgi:hypothetical protein
VQQASGWLATPEPAGTYPLLGVQAGFERLKKAGPIAPRTPAQAPAVEVDTVPGRRQGALHRQAPAGPGRDVTGVRLGLRSPRPWPRPRGPADVAYLLPAYLFRPTGRLGGDARRHRRPGPLPDPALTPHRWMRTGVPSGTCG